jgi:hypothetical protein
MVSHEHAAAVPAYIAHEIHNILCSQDTHSVCSRTCSNCPCLPIATRASTVLLPFTHSMVSHEHAATAPAYIAHEIHDTPCSQDTHSVLLTNMQQLPLLTYCHNEPLLYSTAFLPLTLWYLTSTRQLLLPTLLTRYITSSAHKIYTVSHSRTCSSCLYLPIATMSP